jgi:hypothetical protein
MEQTHQGRSAWRAYYRGASRKLGSFVVWGLAVFGGGSVVVSPEAKAGGVCVSSKIFIEGASDKPCERLVWSGACHFVKIGKFGVASAPIRWVDWRYLKVGPKNPGGFVLAEGSHTAGLLGPRLDEINFCSFGGYRIGLGTNDKWLPPATCYGVLLVGKEPDILTPTTSGGHGGVDEVDPTQWTTGAGA